MIHDPFVDGDATVNIHADTCGTICGYCPLVCTCWCHGTPSADHHNRTETAA